MAVNIVTLTIEDAGGDKSPVSVYVQQTGTYDVNDLGTIFAKRLWDAVRPIIDGVLIDVQVHVKIDFSTWGNNTFDVLSDGEEKVEFQLVHTGARSTRLSLPTVKELLFNGSGAFKTFNTDSSEFADFQHVMIEPVVDGGIDACDRHGIIVRDVVSGIQKFGKR